MNRAYRFVVTGILVVFSMACAAWTQSTQPPPNPTFPPFEQWKAAVLAGDAAALKSLYSTDPPAQIHVSSASVRDAHDADADISFWLGLRARSMKVEVVRDEPRHGHISYIFRTEVQTANGSPLNITDDQSWQQQGDHWRLIDVERTDAPHLKQPSAMSKNIYPADVDAHVEIKEAEDKAAAGHKRLLLVFGANWCFDCHVLDLAFHGPDFAPLLAANYEVVHVDLGPNEEKNPDLVRQYEIPLNKGIPALAVVESDGTLVVSQKNGEFEDVRGLTPEVLLEFLNRWKPQAR